MDLSEAIETLKSGGTILYPTDTIWGIGCDATNEVACGKISKLKKRVENKSYIILVDGFPMIERYIPEFPEVCYDLVDLSNQAIIIIYPSAKGLAPNILAVDGSVGIRITSDPNCVGLIRGLKRPIVSTSANITGASVPLTFADIDPTIKNKVDTIVEVRINEKLSNPSQIIKIERDGEVIIIRA